MRGEPIQGMHWVEVDLEEICAPSKILIDWETAYSENWVVEVSLRISLYFLILTFRKYKSIDGFICY